MITVNFPPNISSLTAPGLTQYDTGQIISMTGTGITTETVQVHFAASGQSSAIVKTGTVLGGVITAEIPDSVLAMGRTITAWAYVIDGDARETRYTAVLPVVNRARPQDYISPAEPPYLTANELLDRVETAETTVSALTTELTTARNGEASLDERLDGTDAQLAETVKSVNNVLPDVNGNVVIESGGTGGSDLSEYITPTLLNGFVAGDSVNQPVRYYIDRIARRVYLNGVLDGLSATSNVAFQFPVELQNVVYEKHFCRINTTTFASVEIDQIRRFQVTNGRQNATIYLNGISFRY